MLCELQLFEITVDEYRKCKGKPWSEEFLSAPAEIEGSKGTRTPDSLFS